MILNNIGLVLDIIGVMIIWWAAHFIPRWVYETDKNGREALIKDKELSPGIVWKRGMNWGLGFLLSGFLFQIAGNLYDAHSG